MQLTYFNEAVENLKQSLGESHTRRLLSKAVYLFNIGQYDYVTFFRNNIGMYPLSSSTKSQYINLILGNLSTHIKVSTMVLFFLIIIIWAIFMRYCLSLRWFQNQKRYINSRISWLLNSYIENVLWWDRLTQDFFSFFFL